MLVPANDSGPIIWSIEDQHDPDSKKDYSLSYQPGLYSTTTAYTKGSIVIPIISNGCMYECVSPGISGSSEPTWGTLENKLTEDNTVKWKCLVYDAKLKYEDTITLSTWSSDNVLITLEDDGILNDNTTIVKVSNVPSTIKKFNLTNHITILRASTRIEEFDKTLTILVKEQ